MHSNIDTGKFNVRINTASNNLKTDLRKNDKEKSNYLYQESTKSKISSTDIIFM
jgi:hypothetical protein